ncbi:MAG: alpha/beta hydrolase [Hydrogenophaga sp.]|uniref:alpha/beta hydrolase n=1 Tax=Hydrogenophaga sp. TaxID=1904254 RepID=UPI002717D53E|nr:alpha/beta hydrolase [Hydrogenophaga sp.]MDO9570022.1 alpha/beta hydrolase [Hydrogenophaga sp.]MDP3372791.1 alpha/beta hydrolase [Hydrogenophaga sp.]
MIHTDIQRFLTDWDAAWSTLPPGAGPTGRRAHFEAVAARMREPHPPGITTQEHGVEVPETGQPVRVRVFRPEASSGPVPALVYMHGGAWMQGSPETHWDITAGLAAANQQIVISIDYALAPERPFPNALHDTVAVVRWAQDQAPTLGIRPDAIAIGGDSAGGNLAAAATLVLRGTPHAPCAQLLVYPAVSFNTDRPSHTENANGPLVTVASMAAVNAMYCPNPADLLTPLAAPLLAQSHAGLPPAFIAVAQYDPLRDEGIAYAEALQAAGVPVHLDRGEGLIHGYLRAKAYCEPVQTRFAHMAAWLKSTAG